MPSLSEAAAAAAASFPDWVLALASVPPPWDDNPRDLSGGAIAGASGDDAMRQLELERLLRPCGGGSSGGGGGLAWRSLRLREALAAFLDERVDCGIRLLAAWVRTTIASVTLPYVRCLHRKQPEE